MFTEAIPPHVRMKANIITVASSPLSFLASVPNNSDDANPKFTPSIDSTNFLSASPSPTPATEIDADFGTPARVADYKLDKVEDDDFGTPAEPESRSSRSPSLGVSVHAPPTKMKQPCVPLSHTTSCSGMRGAPGTRLGSAAVQHYVPEDLMGIGRQCSNRLPPASAIQAMFLYEMQRETEAERLFHSQMFRLAKSEDEVAAQARRLDQMESRMRKLEIDLAVQAAKDKKRIVANEGQLSEQQQGLFKCTARLMEAEEKLLAIANQLNTVNELQDCAAAEAADAVKKAVAAATTNAAVAVGNFDADSFNTMSLEIDVLFNDRDGILGKLTEFNTRVEALFKDVHQIKTRSSFSEPPAPSPPAQPPAAQRLPVTSANGELLDLSIPRGASFRQ